MKPEIPSAYSAEKTKNSNGYLSDTLRPTERRKGEFAFWVREVQHSGGPVLELASGAGRILTVLAEAGVDVYGLEASSEMIELGKRAMHALPVETKQHIRVVQADMRVFTFVRKFPLVIIPFTSFWYNFKNAAIDDIGWDFETSEKSEKEFQEHIERQAENCLSSIVGALAPSGRFIIDNPFYTTHWQKENGRDKRDHCRRWWSRMVERFGFDVYIRKPFDFPDDIIPVLEGIKK
ncbi:MAG TPA: class I SAM-dependent methyltransferase [Candidatus Paceibacterota bacterium]